MNNNKKYLTYIIIVILSAVLFTVWFNIFYKGNNEYLEIVFLDVGQGDSIYIEAPNGKQVLIDSGPNGKILSSISSVIPFADRSIDLVISTHPDSDHIGGMSYIFDRYKIKTFIDNGVTSTSEIYKILENKINKEKSQRIIIKNKKRIILDKNKNIYLDIIFPNKDMSNLEETNDGSIVIRLIYGDVSFLLMGDATKYTENLISWSENDENLKSDVLKLGHHGSKTSTNEFWLEKVEPYIAIISAGKNNRYGHPDQEVIDLLDKLGIKYFETYKEGNIIFRTDGYVLIQK